MKANSDNIWRVPAYLPFLQPELKVETVATAEQKIGFKLPDEYLNLLRKQNGGYIRFCLPEMAHNVIAGIGPHFPSLTDYDWDEFQEYVSFSLHGLVPFDGDGHWHLCIDYRQDSKVPVVTYVDIECDDQQQIAKSFTDYLAILKVEVVDDYVLESILDMEDVIVKLSSSLGITFEPPDSWTHGYPTRRAAMGSSDQCEWLWINPNDVPRGFVREDHKRYNELKDLMPGRGKQYSSLPDGCYILSATEGVRSKIVKVCSDSNFIIRPLKDYINGI